MFSIEVKPTIDHSGKINQDGIFFSKGMNSVCGFYKGNSIDSKIK